jgi:hypothetical protein
MFGYYSATINNEPRTVGVNLQQQLTKEVNNEAVTILEQDDNKRKKEN